MSNAITHFVGPYAFLSNFYEAPFRADGIVFPTVEHYFQAAKVFVVGEPHKNLTYRRIVQAKSAKEAKQLGRQVDLRPDWDSIKLAVMRRGLHLKFSQNDRLAARLMMTGKKELIEGNTWDDTYWGAVCRLNGKTHKHEGQNWLGWLLMAERAHLLANR